MSNLWLTVIGAALTWTGGISYALLIGHPWVRSTAIPNFSLMLAGIGLGVWAAVRAGGGWPTWVAASSVAMTGFFTFAFVVMFRLPSSPATGTEVGDPAPDFAVANQEGQPISLFDFRGRGPVLLVFYRGFW